MCSKIFIIFYFLCHPEINNVLGEPLKNTSFKVIYNPQEHVGFRNNKTILVLSSLPNGNNNGSFDTMFLVNYIHKWLEGSRIPIQGVRYPESIAHPIKEIVAENLASKKLET